MDRCTCPFPLLVYNLRGLVRKGEKEGCEGVKARQGAQWVKEEGRGWRG